MPRKLKFRKKFWASLPNIIRVNLAQELIWRVFCALMNHVTYRNKTLAVLIRCSKEYRSISRQLTHLFFDGQG